MTCSPQTADLTLGPQCSSISLRLMQRCTSRRLMLLIRQFHRLTTALRYQRNASADLARLSNRVRDRLPAVRYVGRLADTFRQRLELLVAIADSFPMRADRPIRRLQEEHRFLGLHGHWHQAPVVTESGQTVRVLLHEQILP